MIDRSYLPFQSAREHYDRGMEKWMGFFLSEHTSSLKADKTKELLHTNLTPDQKALLLSQLYTSHLTGVFTIAKDKDHTKHLKGKITDLTPHEITIKNQDHHQLIQTKDILAIGVEVEGVWEGHSFQIHRGPSQ